MKRWWMGAAVVVAGLGGSVAGGVAHAQAPRYRVVKVLDEWGDFYRVAGVGLNDAGVAIGLIPASDGQPDQYGAVYDGRGKTRLFGPNGVNGSVVNDINSSGQIVGQSFVWMPQEGKFPPISAVVWENDVPRALPLPGGFSRGSATAINDLGEIIGSVQDDQGTHGGSVLWQGTQVTLLPPELTAAFDINGLHQIAGCKRAPNGVDSLPVIYENGQLRPLPLPSPSSVGCATRINDSGVAIGTMSNRATLWQKNGSLLTLVPPGTQTTVTALNNRSEVVGFVGTPGFSGRFYRPSSGSAVWDLGSLIDLQPDQQYLDRGLRNVYGINNRGEILAAMGRCCNNDTGGTLQVLVILAPTPPSGADTQAPVINITSPATGSYLTDTAVLQATASDDVGVAGVQFYVNGLPAGPEDTTAPYSFEVDLVPYRDGQVVPFWATARDAAGNKTTTNIKTLVAQKSCVTIGRAQWSNSYMGNQQGTFTITWTGSPDGVPANSGFGVTTGRGIDQRAAAAAVVFAPDGQLEARDGDHLVPSGVSYQNAFYRFRMVVDVVNRRYSAWYRLLNQPEQPLAANFALQGAPTLLDYWVASTDSQSPSPTQTVCNVKAKASP
jgi:hypothetical protein